MQSPKHAAAGGILSPSSSFCTSSPKGRNSQEPVTFTQHPQRISVLSGCARHGDRPPRCPQLSSSRCSRPARATPRIFSRCSTSCPATQSTEVKYPLLRSCSSSAALTAAGLHTHDIGRLRSCNGFTKTVTLHLRSIGPTSNGIWPTLLPPESTNKRIVSDDSPEIKVACERKIKYMKYGEYERVEQPPF